VGNQSAAQNKSMLNKAGVTHVVNCTDNMPMYHERDPSRPKINYLRFPASFWMQHQNNIPAFIQPLFDFVDAALAKGENVLVHCLAGAHRAGTTGCLLLMYKANMAHQEAIRSAKKLRPVIDPIGGYAARGCVGGASSRERARGRPRFRAVCRSLRARSQASRAAQAIRGTSARKTAGGGTAAPRERAAGVWRGDGPPDGRHRREMSAAWRGPIRLRTGGL